MCRSGSLVRALSVGVALLFAATPFADPVKPAVEVELVADAGDVVVLRLRLLDWQMRDVPIQGEAHQQPWIPGEPLLLVRGQPALPHVNRSLVIPDDRRMELRVLSTAFHEIPARIAPSKGKLSRAVDPADVPWEFGEVYAEDAFFPGPLARPGEPYVLRDLRGLVVRFQPFQYNPVAGLLRVHDEITVQLTAVGPGQVNVLDRTVRGERPSRAFEVLYRSHFLNYMPTVGDTTLDEGGEMLIIAHDPWISNLQPLAEHKTSIGIPTTIVGVSSIGNSPSAIQSYIETVYAASDLAFVLLVGDVQQVASPTSWGGASDPSYSKLAGDDDYPEILVGRFSAGTAAEVDTQVQRTIDHETAPATAQDWFWRGVGIASAEGAGIGDDGQADFQHMSEIRDWLLGAGYTLVDEIYDPGATSGQVTSALNAGRGLVNYTGHGSAWSWGTSGFDTGAVHALTNAGQLPIIFSVACNNGEFEHYDECFAEAWMRATDDGQPSGAAGVYASSILQSWAPPMEAQDEFNLLLTDPAEPYYSFGALAFAGSCSMMDDYGVAGVEMFDTWILFGDPSLRVVGAAAPSPSMEVLPEGGLTLEGRAGGPYEPAEHTFTIRNLGEARIDFRVTTTLAWIALSGAEGTLWPGEEATATATITESARNLDNGDFAGALEFVNLTDHGGDTVRPVLLRVGEPIVRHQWSLDNDPGWTTDGDWAFGQPAGLGGNELGFPDPDSGVTGPNVYGVNLQGDYAPFVHEPFRLTTAAIDVSDSGRVTLRYRRWLNTEGSPGARNSVEASADGVAWSEVWENEGNVTENGWSTQEHDLTAAAGPAAVHVRWGYSIGPGATPCAGWNVDDVEILGVPLTARSTLTVGPLAVSWTPLDGAAAYDVVRGELNALRATAGDFALATAGCVADDVDSTTVDFAGEPDPGQGYWLLVRGVSGSGPMTFQALAETQSGVRDEEIAASGLGCP